MILEKIRAIENDIKNLPVDSLNFNESDKDESQSEKIARLILDRTSSDSTDIRERIFAEFDAFGPIDCLLTDPSVTEILINSPVDIWFEKEGRLHQLNDHFSSDLTYRHFVERLCLRANITFNFEQPAANGTLPSHRVHIIGFDLCEKHPLISLRRHPDNPWTFSKLKETGWATSADIQIIEEILHQRENFIVIGGTGSGKTSLLNACLQQLPKNERVVIIEDTSELKLPNSCSGKLVTRSTNNGILSPIDQSELVKQSLRMRPDRLVIGEVRGPEAKDLVLALSTGHRGCFGSLHANCPHQALMRLEMLVQLGAPQWSLQTIRKMIFLSVQYIVTVEKNTEGKRALSQIHKLSSIEESGILLNRVR